MDLSEKKYISILSALTYGLLGFFMLESAIARRIGADLLLPWAAGALLPGRLARLGACLVLGFALALTDRGRRLRRGLDSLLQKEPGRWAVSAAVTALFFLWAWRVTVFSFKTNDDTQILRAISDGSFWTLSSAFTHPLLCAALAWLYRLAPGVCWYGGYHLAIQAIAMTVLGRCLYLKLCRRLPGPAAVSAHWLLGMGVFLFTLCRLSFTVTPAIAGTAAVALLLCRDDTDGAAGHIAADLGGALLMLLSWLQRGATGKVMLCFWLLAAAYRLARLLLRRGAGLGRRTALLFLTAALAPALIFAAARIPLPDGGKYTPDPVTGYSYSAAEYYRYTVMDYYLDKLSDEQLEAVGLPPELTTLLRNWYFMDERINTDTFRAIVETYPDAVSSLSADSGTAPAASDSAVPAAPASDSGAAADSAPAAEPAPAADSGPSAPAVFARLRSMIASSTAIMSTEYSRIAGLMTAGLVLLLLLVLLRLLRYGLAGWPETLCALCAAGGGAILLLYLVSRGRMPLRAFLVPVIPTAAVMLLMAADAPAGDFRTPARRAGALLSGALALCLAALCFVIARSVPLTDAPVTRQEAFADQTATEAYAHAHPELTLITHDLSNDLDPFHDPRSYPDNLTRWGNPGVTASSDRLYADDLFRPDVQFVFDQQRLHFVLELLQYLSLDYGPVQVQRLVPLTTNYAVSAISRVLPEEEGYTGWYERNGMTYYFRDGQAVTGEQTIDGESYTFAPAGAASQISVMPDPAGIIYTTDAYSLIEPEADTP